MMLIKRKRVVCVVVIQRQESSFLALKVVINPDPEQSSSHASLPAPLYALYETSQLSWGSLCLTTLLAFSAPEMSQLDYRKRDREKNLPFPLSDVKSGMTM